MVVSVGFLRSSQALLAQHRGSSLIRSTRCTYSADSNVLDEWPLFALPSTSRSFVFFLFCLSRIVRRKIGWSNWISKLKINKYIYWYNNSRRLVLNLLWRHWRLIMAKVVSLGLICIKVFNFIWYFVFYRIKAIIYIMY